jgi:hypothetical protein
MGGPPVTIPLGGNTPRATNEAFVGTTTDGKAAKRKASASIYANSDSVSNEIDESDWQSEKQDEQRI